MTTKTTDNTKYAEAMGKLNKPTQRIWIEQLQIAKNALKYAAVSAPTDSIQSDIESLAFRLNRLTIELGEKLQ